MDHHFRFISLAICIISVLSLSSKRMFKELLIKQLLVANPSSSLHLPGHQVPHSPHCR
jgi:hypothetical protein